MLRIVRCLGHVLRGAAVLAAVTITTSVANSQSVPTAPAPLPKIPAGETEILVQIPETIKSELWVGGDVSANSWFAFHGSTSSIFGGVTQPGWRVRAVGGYGNYSYDAVLPINNQPVATKVKGTAYTLEALVGYQWHFDRLVSKAFVGIDHQTHLLTPVDVRAKVAGSAYGVKLAVENWITIGDSGFASLDGAWSSAFNSYWAQLRAGARVSPWFTIGAEAAVLGNEGYDAGRVGLLAKMDTTYGDLMLSAGATGDIDQNFGFYSATSFNVRF